MIAMYYLINLLHKYYKCTFAINYIIFVNTLGDKIIRYHTKKIVILWTSYKCLLSFLYSIGVQFSLSLNLIVK